VDCPTADAPTADGAASVVYPVAAAAVAGSASVGYPVAAANAAGSAMCPECHEVRRLVDPSGVCTAAAVDPSGVCTALETVASSGVGSVAAAASAAAADAGTVVEGRGANGGAKGGAVQGYRDRHRLDGVVLRSRMESCWPLCWTKWRCGAVWWDMVRRWDGERMAAMSEGSIVVGWAGLGWAGPQHGSLPLAL
jgi:hypothetical protein